MDHGAEEDEAAMILRLSGSARDVLTVRGTRLDEMPSFRRCEWMFLGACGLLPFERL